MNILAQGTNSSVYSFDASTIVKKCSDDVLAFLHDIKVHLILDRILQSSKDTECLRAKIPILYEYSDKHVIMQRLDGTLHELLSNTRCTVRRNHIVVRVMRQIANLLHYLQERCEFQHRDLHCCNIMYTVSNNLNEWNCSVQDLQFYVIDFGYSTVSINNQHLSFSPDLSLQEIQKREKFAKKTNFGHDLTTLCLSLRNYFDESGSGMPSALSLVIRKFFTCALRSRVAYTERGRHILKKRKSSLGFTYDKNAPPMFWFSYTATSFFQSLLTPTELLKLL